MMRHRIKGVVGGVAIALYGLAMMWRGKFEYHNVYWMTLYSPAIVATGGLTCVLSLLPVSWVEWMVYRKKAPMMRLSHPLHKKAGPSPSASSGSG